MNRIRTFLVLMVLFSLTLLRVLAGDIAAWPTLNTRVARQPTQPHKTSEDESGHIERCCRSAFTL